MTTPNENLDDNSKWQPQMETLDDNPDDNPRWQT
jgi:hypothetical protein